MLLLKADSCCRSALISSALWSLALRSRGTVLLWHSVASGPNLPAALLLLLLSEHTEHTDISACEKLPVHHHPRHTRWSQAHTSLYHTITQHSMRENRALCLISACRPGVLPPPRSICHHPLDESSEGTSEPPSGPFQPRTLRAPPKSDQPTARTAPSVATTEVSGLI